MQVEWKMFGLKNLKPNITKEYLKVLKDSYLNDIKGS